MSDSYFFDTDILAYAFDRSDPTKWKTASALVKGGFEDGGGVLSNQVLAELFVVLTQKVSRPVPREEAAGKAKSFANSGSWTKVSYTSGTVAKAAQDSAAMPNHFWDLLIAETMKEAGVKRVYTENLKDFAGIPWVEAVNPFARKGGAKVARPEKGQAAEDGATAGHRETSRE